jgi:hypothetical protein
MDENCRDGLQPLKRNHVTHQHLGLQAHIIHFHDNAVMRASAQTGEVMNEGDSEDLEIRPPIQSLFVRHVIDFVSVMVAILHPDEFKVCATFAAGLCLSISHFAVCD